QGDPGERDEPLRRYHDIAHRLVHVYRYHGGTGPAAGVRHGHRDAHGCVAGHRRAADREAAGGERGVTEAEAEREARVVIVSLPRTGVRQLVEELRLVAERRGAGTAEVRPGRVRL